ncbi:MULTISPECIES: galactose ABC transporter substrate-binding protein [unclassified Clostridium]|uniref:galactose ABC transporter substrate-binding protein n=1 Tax=unclassified Clostridium TaxID=2614128 RepID=UPI0002984345|nr:MULTISPECIES: galactose ABC transporter substrate-binding protein [unclassified Clostridium]EKQ53053.1 MAG: ABC-type sugar transport system, periplasmic component [Clostridium sp. Maddingley MBC34-26]
MNILKRAIGIIIIIFTTITLIDAIHNYGYANTNSTLKKTVKVGVFLSTFNDEYLSLVKQNLEDIQKENKDTVQFIFHNANGNQGSQNEAIDKALNNNFDFLVLDLVNANAEAVSGIFNKINEKNIPLIIYLDPTNALVNLIKSHNRTIIIGTDSKQSGELEGKIIVNAWNTNKENIDKNNDNTLQYILLHGETFNPTAIARTKYSIQTINSAGIKTELLALRYCNWDRECARTNTESLLLKYGNKIEAIISNNDAMAIGAIEALQKQGYFKGDKSTYIPVVGIDAIPEARELIKKGFMTGTVIQDPRQAAEAIYTVGMNMVNGNYPLAGTKYTFDETGKVIRLPYYEYKA